MLNAMQPLVACAARVSQTLVSGVTRTFNKLVGGAASCKFSSTVSKTHTVVPFSDEHMDDVKNVALKNMRDLVHAVGPQKY